MGDAGPAAESLRKVGSLADALSAACQTAVAAAEQVRDLLASHIARGAAAPEARVRAHGCSLLTEG
jgi:hypothetical protein